jgi:hypothetical protein
MHHSWIDDCVLERLTARDWSAKPQLLTTLFVRSNYESMTLGRLKGKRVRRING